MRRLQKRWWPLLTRIQMAVMRMARFSSRVCHQQAAWCAPLSVTAVIAALWPWVIKGVLACPGCLLA